MAEIGPTEDPIKMTVWRCITRAITLLTLPAIFVGSQSSPALAQRVPPSSGLPTGMDWQVHLEEDVMPFWMPAQTLGDPGNFPTYRCNDGRRFDQSHPCPELDNPAGGVVWLSREYLRMKSRQVYGYGVAYHMTGDPRYLDLAKQGTDYIIKHGFQRVGDDLVPITFWDSAGDHAEPEPEPKVAQRTSQDMAYSLTGIGFYYYLTRDPEILKTIQAVKAYIFKTYYDNGQHIMRWVSENYREETTDRWELTAQLDQIYGYMIWLTPSLPFEEQSKWRADLNKLAHAMKDRFYAGDCAERESDKSGCGLFWGDMTQGHMHQVGAAHNDYGHSVKAMWMIYTVGKMTGDKELEEFGRTGARRIVRRAYNAKTGSWNRDPLSEDKEWWILCELDQTSLTLALSEPEYSRYAASSWKYWKTYMVDHEHHEVWHLVKANTNKPDLTLPKQHAWKNMMHTTEHALVGYILSNELQGEPVNLYFAWKQRPPDELIHPYLYDGKIQSVESKDGHQRVTFTHIH